MKRINEALEKWKNKNPQKFDRVFFGIMVTNSDSVNSSDLSKSYKRVNDASIAGERNSGEAGLNSAKKVKTSNQAGSQRNVSILSDNLDVSGAIIYRPQTQITAGVYKEILSVLQTLLTCESSEALYEAAHEVISVLRSDQPDHFRRRDLCGCLGVDSVSDEFYSSLYRLCMLISDFDVPVSSSVGEVAGGIAVTFDEEDDEKEEVVAFVEEEEPERVISAVESVWTNLSGELRAVFGSDSLAKDVGLLVVANVQDPHGLENRLADLFAYEHFNLIKKICHHRFRVWLEFGKYDISRLVEFPDDERAGELYRELAVGGTTGAGFPQPSTTLDLSLLMFAEGGRLMTNPTFNPSTKTFQVAKKNYDEVHVQAPEKVVVASGELVEIRANLPEWAWPAFSGFERLNPVQSKVFPVAFGNFYENMLICAPTGAGKTNIAMLTMLNAIHTFAIVDGVINTAKLNRVKIVYIAPMKALVQEVVKSFALRLAPLGIKVAELSGDSNLSREQMAETTLVVTTPEKWDVVTRKPGDVTKCVKLVIIDEVHLLHDSRGPVLEAIVARTVRQIEANGENVRLVALSATLPNYRDVGIFLRVNPDVGLAYFGSEYRPVPLEQTYIGIKTKKALKRGQVINEVVFEKVLEEVESGNQVLVFVHGRKETVRTANEIRRLAGEAGKLALFSGTAGGVLEHESGKTTSRDLATVLPSGIGVHHAGLLAADRSLVEDLFAARHLSVCVCTLTLAWGVNLPAHTVVIKGTQIYSPEKGNWVELSPMDMMQMMGRAGRPQYDVSGHGIVITNVGDLQYYLSLNNMQLPIESQLLAVLPDLVNAELALGTVSSRDDVAEWIGYTYLHVRMLQNRALYGVPPDDDPKLLQHRSNLAHSCLQILDKFGLAKYDRRSGLVQITAIGRVASYYYLKHESVSMYSENLTPNLADIDILALFAKSDEFKYIPVREEEKIELSKLVELVPVPLKGGAEDGYSKINVLLQAYVSRLSLEGFALMADMVFVTQSAGRLFRALFELSMKRNWSSLSRKLLVWCKIVELRFWPIQTQLRHFRSVSDEICKKIERKGLSNEELLCLNSEELGDLLRNPKQGKEIHSLLQQIPKLELTAYVQPISRSSLHVKVDIRPVFTYSDSAHAETEYFWIFVEDVSQQFCLYSDQFALRREQICAQAVLTLAFMVSVTDPVPPYYFVRVVSDKWMGSETTSPISFRNLIIPAKSAAPTEMLDLEPLPIPEALATTSSFSMLNAVQTQVYHSVYNSDENVFLGAPVGAGKHVCVELAILRLISQSDRKCVVLGWSDFAVANARTCQLSGEEDLEKLETHQVIFTNEKWWDLVSKKWKSPRIRAILAHVGLFVVCDLHRVAELGGGLLEVVVSRMRDLSTNFPHMRIIGTSVSVANGDDLASWIGAKTIYNFPPHARNTRLELTVHGFDVFNRQVRQSAMLGPLKKWLVKHNGGLVFTTDKRQARNAAAELMVSGLSFLPGGEIQLDSVCGETLVSASTRKLLSSGIGMIFPGMPEVEKLLIEYLFTQGVILVCFVVNPKITKLKSKLVVVLDTSVWSSVESQFVDYRPIEVLEILGKSVDRAVLFVANSKRDFYKKFINEPIPVESVLDEDLGNLLNSEIASGAIKTVHDCMGWISSTFFYRRLLKNPNYYSLQGTSHEQISEYLSELVEDELDNLQNAGMIVQTDEGIVSVADLGLIASYYSVKVATIELFRRSLTESIRRKALIELLANATEFDSIDVAPEESSVLAQIATQAKLPTPQTIANGHLKVLILLYSHFLRIPLTHDLKFQLENILKTCQNLLFALVDVASTCGWLKVCLSAMEIAPMLRQGLLASSSALLQIPGFDQERVVLANSLNCEDVYDLLGLPEKDRAAVLDGLTTEQIHAAAVACNAYPSVSLTTTISSTHTNVAIERHQGAGNWWLLLASGDQIVDIKRITKQVSVSMRPAPPGAKLFLMSDAYIGCDQEEEIEV